MSVSEQTSYNSSTGNGVTTVFPYTFKILAAADLEVTVDGVVKALTTDYSVSGAGDDAGGDVTFVTAPASGTTVIRRRNMAFARSTDYQYQGELANDVLNADQDAPVLMIQQLAEGLSRTLQLPVEELGSDNEVPGATLRLGRMLMFDPTTGAPKVTDFTESQVASTIAAAYSGAAGPIDALSFIADGVGAEPRTAQDKMREALSIEDFADAGDPDDTLAIQRALVAGKSLGRKILASKASYSFSSMLTIDGTWIEAAGAGRVTMTYTGTGIAVTIIAGEKGAGFVRTTLQSGASGQTGIYLSGAVGIILESLYVNKFDTGQIRIGNTGSAEGVYWSRISDVRLRLDTNQNGTYGVLIDGQSIPSSNANLIKNVVIGGNYQYPLWIKGQGNVIEGGTIEMTRPHENLISMINIEGAGNVVRDVYVEPIVTSGFGTAKMITFGANATGNHVEVWPQFVPTYNVSSFITDSGAHNKVKLKRAGGNYKIGTEAEPSHNLVMNSNFRVWRDANNPVGWLAGTARISRVAPSVTGEPYTLRMTEVASASTIQHYLTDYFTSTTGGAPIDLAYLRGKPVIAGVWCKASTAGLGGVKILNLGGDDASYGADKHSGSGNWELLLAHRQIPSASTRVGIELRSHPDNTAATATVDFRDPFFIIGTDVFFFTPKPLSDSGGKMSGDLEFPLDYTDKGLSGVIRLNGYYLWVDTTGDLRIGATRPTNATWDSAGAIVGTQS